MGVRPMVGLRTLDPYIEVRILDPQPELLLDLPPPPFEPPGPSPGGFTFVPSRFLRTGRLLLFHQKGGQIHHSQAHNETANVDP